MKKTTTKKMLWFLLINGVAWVWSSYLLAAIGRDQIAESLSKTAVTEIIGVAFIYCFKALFEKKASFGAVGRTEIQRDA